jgi:hypothetical protein
VLAANEISGLISIQLPIIFVTHSLGGLVVKAVCFDCLKLRRAALLSFLGNTTDTDTSQLTVSTFLTPNLSYNLLRYPISR